MKEPTNFVRSQQDKIHFTQLFGLISQSFARAIYLRAMGLKETYKKYYPYFVDIWQYLVIILIFIVAALFIL